MSASSSSLRRKAGSTALPGSWLVLLVLLVACAEEPLPERQLARDDCLRDVKLDRLDEALRRCDEVVRSFPNDPTPLNERFLLHTLADDEKAACRDITRANELARSQGIDSLDPLLQQDLKLRLASCQE